MISATSTMHTWSHDLDHISSNSHVGKIFELVWLNATKKTTFSQLFSCSINMLGSMPDPEYAPAVKGLKGH